MNITLEALRGAIQRSARMHQIGGHTLTIVDAGALDGELALLDGTEAAADDAQMDLLAPPAPLPLTLNIPVLPQPLEPAAEQEQALANVECPPAPEAPAEGS